MICWNVGVAAAAVWAWSVTCPFGRKRDSTSSFQKRTNSRRSRRRTDVPCAPSSGPGTLRDSRLRASGAGQGRRDGDATMPAAAGRRRRERLPARGAPAVFAQPRPAPPLRQRVSRRPLPRRSPRPQPIPAAMRSARRREPVWYAYSWCTSRSASPVAAEAGCSRSSASGRAMRLGQRVDRLRRDRHGLAGAVAADEPAARGREAERAAARPAGRAVLQHRQVAGLVQQLEQRPQHERRLDGAAGDAAVELAQRVAQQREHALLGLVLGREPGGGLADDRRRRRAPRGRRAAGRRRPRAAPASPCRATCPGAAPGRRR